MYLKQRLETSSRYFSPVELGDERYTKKLYFQTEIYNRTWPTLMADRMAHQIETLKHAEIGIVAFDTDFRKSHREAVLSHCKMALAYLDAREARIAMKLCESLQRKREQNSIEFA